MQEKEIKPCPFCGWGAALAEAVIEGGSEHAGDHTYTVVCRGCGVGIFGTLTKADEWNAFASPEAALEAWNRRFP